MSIYKKMRLDRILVDRGLALTCSRAADLIRLGAVSVDGERALKPGAMIEPGARLIVDAQGSPFVSRGGQARRPLDAFGLDPKGFIALDIGASTGGFTEVLLERGASRLYAVDVGREQLHAKLRDDPRVVGLEGMDARRPDAGSIEKPVGAVVADVSFKARAETLAALVGAQGHHGLVQSRDLRPRPAHPVRRRLPHHPRGPGRPVPVLASHRVGGCPGAVIAQINIRHGRARPGHPRL
jgi:predicted rRNA methylase YqxC with S4 and FtsJ domains